MYINIVNAPLINSVSLKWLEAGFEHATQSDPEKVKPPFMLTQHLTTALAAPILDKMWCGLVLNMLISITFSNGSVNCSLSVATDILTYCKFYCDLLGSSDGRFYRRNSKALWSGLVNISEAQLNYCWPLSASELLWSQVTSGQWGLFVAIILLLQTLSQLFLNLNIFNGHHLIKWRSNIFVEAHIPITLFILFVKVMWWKC